MIPEWLSFQNEFIPSPYISLYLFTWYWDEISSPHKSFRNELIPVFNPNEILVLVWYFILVSCKLKTNSVPRWKRKPCSLGWVAHASHFQNGGQNGRFQDSWAGRFCHVNAVWTSFWNETHSGMKLILVSCEQPLSSCYLEHAWERKMRPHDKPMTGQVWTHTIEFWKITTPLPPRRNTQPKVTSILGHNFY